MNRFIYIFFLLLICCFDVMGQGSVGVKTNLLYGGVALTPNLGVEIGLGRRTTLDIEAGYNPWRVDSERKLAHAIVQPEFRYYLCERFNGHFFGAHLIYARYNIAKHNLPMLFGDDSRYFRYEGSGYGGGLSYGYQWLLSHRWNLEAQIGAGYVLLDYDRNCPYKCGPSFGSEHTNYWGVTRCGISLVYIIK